MYLFSKWYYTKVVYFVVSDNTPKKKILNAMKAHIKSVKTCFVFTLQVYEKQVKAYKVSNFAAVKSGN